MQEVSGRDSDRQPATRETGLKQKYANKEGKVTTLMIRNIPTTYTQDMLMEEIIDCVGSAHSFDFFYMPWDQQHDCNVGYAFVNYRTAAAAERCVRILTNFKFRQSTSTKTCTVYPAHIQGLENNILHLMDRAVSDARSHYPVIIWKGNKVKLGSVINTLERLDGKVPAFASRGEGTGCTDDLFEPEGSERGSAPFQMGESAATLEMSLLEAMPNLMNAMQRQRMQQQRQQPSSRLSDMDGGGSVPGTKMQVYHSAPRSMPVGWRRPPMSMGAMSEGIAVQWNQEVPCTVPTEAPKRPPPAGLAMSADGHGRHSMVAHAAPLLETGSSGPTSLSASIAPQLEALPTPLTEAPTLPPPAGLAMSESGHWRYSMMAQTAPELETSSTGRKSLSAFTASQIEAPPNLPMPPMLPPPAGLTMSAGGQGAPLLTGFPGPQLEASSTRPMSLSAFTAPQFEAPPALPMEPPMLPPPGGLAMSGGGHGPPSMQAYNDSQLKTSSTGPADLRAFPAPQPEAPATVPTETTERPPPAGLVMNGDTPRTSPCMTADPADQLGASSTPAAHVKDFAAPVLQATAPSPMSQTNVNPMSQTTIHTIKVMDPNEDVISRFFKRYGP